MARTKSSRGPLGRRSNQVSKSPAPVAVTRSGGSPWSSIASRRWISFQTKTCSGCHLSRPLFVRLSQLATSVAAGMPSARALFRNSTCGEASLTTEVASTTSGCCSRT